jgi:hypothetical protein
MRIKPSYACALVLCILFTASVSLGAENPMKQSPSAFFPESRYEFTPVVAGIDVTHAFVVQNKGTEPLHIEKVKTG